MCFAYANPKCDGNHENCLRFDRIKEIFTSMSDFTISKATSASFPEAVKKRIGSKRKTIFCGVIEKIAPKYDIQLEKMLQDKEEELVASKKAALDYYQFWKDERKEKESAIAEKIHKPTHLPPSCYIAMSDLVSVGSDLGSGVYGSVSLYKFKGRTVAVKKIINEEISIKGQRNVVLKEAKVMLNLRYSENLPSFVGVIIDAPPYCIVMDYCDFEGSSLSLWKLFKTKRFPLQIQEVHKILYSITDALIIIHRSGYLHNDLKMDNVVLRGNRNCFVPVIIDFGKSTLISDGKLYNLCNEKKKEYKVKYRHIAPEVVDGYNRQSIYSDIYALAYIMRNIQRFDYQSPQLTKIVKNTYYANTWCLRSSLESIRQILK